MIERIKNDELSVLCGFSKLKKFNLINEFISEFTKKSEVIYIDYELNRNEIETYTSIKDSLIQQYEEKNNYLSTLYEWVKIYRNNLDQEPVDVELEFEELVNTLEKSLAEKIEQATISRYALWMEEIGKKYFLKIKKSTTIEVVDLIILTLIIPKFMCYVIYYFSLIYFI